MQNEPLSLDDCEPNDPPKRRGSRFRLATRREIVGTLGLMLAVILFLSVTSGARLYTFFVVFR